MAGIIPFALIFKFKYISHILLLITAIIPIVVLGIKHKDVVQSIFSEKTVYLKKHLVCKENVVISNKIFCFFDYACHTVNMLAYGKPYPCTLCQRRCKFGTVYIR